MPRQNNIRFRKGSSSEWIATNPVLSSGEPGYDLSNKILKVGDGTSTWTQLSGINQNDHGSLFGLGDDDHSQ